MKTPFRWFLLAGCGLMVMSSSARAQPDPAAAPAAEQPAEAMPPPPPPAPPPPPPPASNPPASTSAAAAAPSASPVPAAQSPFRIETPNGSNVKLGLLMQPQFQAAGDAARDGASYNLFIRRTRVLIGGTLFGMFDYFFDTDYPNLFLANTVMGAMGAADTAVKNTPGMNIQDAFITYKPLGDLIKVDMGYMLPPLAHNAVQGATTLYAWDYLANSFPAGGNLFGGSTSPIGRDAGVQLRGLLVGGHLEYRIGLFQGVRVAQTPADPVARNFFRTTARVQVNLLDAETGFFYAGTYLGTKKILSIGASADLQDDYRYFAGDVFADLPLGPGVLTAQVNLARWDGNTFLPALAEQTAFMAEAGFLVGGILLSPIIRFEQLWVTGANDTRRIGGGLAFWPYGHNVNIKAFYTDVKVENAAESVGQFNLQWQLYFF